MTSATDNPEHVLPEHSRIATPRRVLIILSGAIGDVVRALPLLGRLRAAWPDTHIAWTIEPKSQPILEGHRWIDELIVYDRRRPWLFPLFLVRLRRGRFDLVIDLQRHLKSGLSSLVSGAPERIGFGPRNCKEGNHHFNTRHIAPQPPLRLKLLQYQAFADLIGLPPTPIEFGLEPSPAERERASTMLAGAPRPLLGVILGSSWPSRIWPAELVAEALRMLGEPSAEVPRLYPILLGGQEEVELAARVTALLPPGHVLNLAGRTSLRDLMAIFELCPDDYGGDPVPSMLFAHLSN
jgi:ADP-heptose:LPS heptosyltransferase